MIHIASVIVFSVLVLQYKFTETEVQDRRTNTKYQQSNMIHIASVKVFSVQCLAFSVLVFQYKFTETKVQTGQKNKRKITMIAYDHSSSDTCSHTASFPQYQIQSVNKQCTKTGTTLRLQPHQIHTYIITCSCCGYKFKMLYLF